MKFVVGNWKMNQNLEGIKSFFMAMDKLKFDLKCEAWIAPQAVHIPILKDLAFSLGRIKVGAQTCSEHDNGAFTGEVSAATLADMGVEFVILGHSERRTIFQESNTAINLKMKKALSQDLTTIFCIGETLAEREANQTFDVVKKQIIEGLKEINFSDSILVAYEPVWAIGTGKTATPDQAQEVHAFIRSELKKLWGEQGSLVPILYGGSVKPSNFAELLSKPDIDGGLVGGASLVASDFRELCLAASQNL
ncbi:MAG: triose-phosphate isomerase [Bacteriovoracaceae bacterium]